MSVFMTAKAWWTSFSSCAMAASTVAACPVCITLLILLIECVLLSCSLVCLPVSMILCCELVLLLGTYFYVYWFGAYGLFLWTYSHLELMLWMIEILEGLAAP